MSLIVRGPIRAGGAFVTIQVGVSKPRARLLAARGVKAPDFIWANALIDTGASCTCVDKAILAELGMPPSGKARVHTSSTAGRPTELDIYDTELRITLPPGSIKIFPAIPVIATQLASHDKTVEALIGRDVLNSCLMIFDGEASQFSLSF